MRFTPSRHPARYLCPSGASVPGAAPPSSKLRILQPLHTAVWYRSGMRETSCAEHRCPSRKLMSRPPARALACPRRAGLWAGMPKARSHWTVPMSTPGEAAWREQRADGRAGRADNPLIPSTPRGLSRAELGHGGHSGTGAPPAPAACPGGTWGPAGLGADRERGWAGRVCWAGLGSGAGPRGSPLTVPLPSFAAVVTGSVCPRARVSSTRSCTSWPLLCAASCCPALWPRLSRRR